LDGQQNHIIVLISVDSHDPTIIITMYRFRYIPLTREYETHGTECLADSRPLRSPPGPTPCSLLE
jgi:hypothetical protein